MHCACSKSSRPERYDDLPDLWHDDHEHDEYDDHDNIHHHDHGCSNRVQQQQRLSQIRVLRFPARPLQHVAGRLPNQAPVLPAQHTRLRLRRRRLSKSLSRPRPRGERLDQRDLPVLAPQPEPPPVGIE